MGKQKQQVISRFFAPKPSSTPASSQPQNPPTTPPPKIATTVSFSPAKRIRTSQLTSTHKKVPKILHPSPSGDTPNFPLPNPTLHQKFLDKLLEPPTDLLEPSRNKNRNQAPNPKYTPLEQQVVELKTRYPDVLLMVEVGYRYRFFGEDAENAARVLGIFAHMDHNFLTASVPTFRLNVHARRLVSAGYKVGVVKQSETAAIKAHGSNRLGPFVRGLSALYTKATLEAAEDLGGGEEGCVRCNNYMLCIVEKMGEDADVRIGAVGVEISTGDVVYAEFDDDFMRSGLEAMVLHLSPAELLLGGRLSKQTEKLLLAYAGPSSNVRVEHASQDCFHDRDALAEVISQYERLNKSNVADDYQKQGHIEGIKAMPDLAVQALVLTIHHLQQFGFEKFLCLGSSFRPFSSITEMTLSANALQQLEVLKNNSDGSESGSLLQCLNRTLTVFGSRLLRHWVTHPLCDRNMIQARQDAISEILESMGSTKASETDLNEENSGITIVNPNIHDILSSALTTLGRAPDIQRGITRIFHGTATASEFIAVIQAILVAARQLQKLHVEITDENKNLGVGIVRSVLLRKLILTASSLGVTGTASRLLSKLNKEAADQRDLQNLFIISGGSFPEVATARTKVSLAKEMLDQLLSLFRKQLRMSNLEYTSVSGATHLIEALQQNHICSTFLSLDVKVPSDWVKVNSTKKTIRYHPPEVLKALDQLTLVNEELSAVCRATWDGFVKTFSGLYSEFHGAVQALAALDCLYSLAVLSRTKNFVRPIFVSDDEPVQINIESGRHPVMENILNGNFVPNDTHLHGDGQYCQIVTGPNMGGKSCYIRQVALIALMAQVGCFVPASSAKLHVLDGIYTRMGASDSIHLGKSTFLEELSEASHILRHCTSRSLIIMDELGRGTSTHDGVAIAHATLHYLLEQKKCIVLFVTHYPEIVGIRDEFPGSVGAYHVSYLTLQEDSNSASHDDVTYLYKLVPGVSERSFGFKVAQLAQLPPSCIRRAIEMAAKLEAEVRKREKHKLVPMSNNKSEHSETLEETEVAYRELFFHLNLALNNEADSRKRFESLEHAKSLAAEMVNRLQL